MAATPSSGRIAAEGLANRSNHHPAAPDSVHAYPITCKRSKSPPSDLAKTKVGIKMMVWVIVFSFGIGDDNSGPVYPATSAKEYAIRGMTRGQGAGHLPPLG
jgi:hypothetical protein